MPPITITNGSDRPSDAITSHDKRRFYLECLEEYVLWLHEQLRLIGNPAAGISRVIEYGGLTTRSIRVSVKLGDSYHSQSC